MASFRNWDWRRIFLITVVVLLGITVLCAAYAMGALAAYFFVRGILYWLVGGLCMSVGALIGLVGTATLVDWAKAKFARLNNGKHARYDY